MRLAETIGHWFGRMEVVLAGADDTLHQGEVAISMGDAMAARASAREVLQRVPGSPLGLALLADACALGGLDAELTLTLEELALRVARADVWVRLARARQTTGAPLADVREALVRALAVAEPGSDARREALLSLADLDIAQQDGGRAEMWLDRTASDSSDVALRRVEARLLRGDVAAARALLPRLADSPADARVALARGRTLAQAGDAGAFAPLLRAMVLDEPGASELLSSSVSWLPCDEETLARVRQVVGAKNEAGLARWRAAFARGAGRREEARLALLDAVSAGETSAARSLLDLALEDQDEESLRVALASLPEDAQAGAVVRDATLLPAASSLLDPPAFPDVLERMSPIMTPRALAWADRVREDIAAKWLPREGTALWSELLARLDDHARALHDLDASAHIAAVSAERARPVRVAIVGEFNAGKSTFINALMGADIAPTGVLPTTASLHHLRYAPDPIARVLLSASTGGSAGGSPGGTGAAQERVVPVAELRRTLKETDPRLVKRVEILLPISFLTSVEILDTPGFNAPDAKHSEVARAAFMEADACIWLLDAGQAFKQTEREVLDEAQKAKMPIQILVNKVDRIAPVDLPKVMDLVDAALAEVALVSWSPPIGFSAKRALAGKLGDAGAAAASGWAAVEDMLQRQIILRSDELKERSLRRRASIVVAELLARASREAAEEAALAAGASERGQRLSRALARLDREQEDAGTRLSASLAPFADAWLRDLDVVVTGRDVEAAKKDPVLARYRIDRALSRLAVPLGHALAAMASEAALTPADVAMLARASVRAFSAAPEARDVRALSRAAIGSLVDYLGVLAVPPPLVHRAAGRARELESVARALQ